MTPEKNFRPASYAGRRNFRSSGKSRFDASKKTTTNRSDHGQTPSRQFFRGQKPAGPTQEKNKQKWVATPQVAKRSNDKGESQVLKIIPIGGCEEVGRNMTVFEYGNDIVILDMGIQFPEEDMPGIDYIIPNINYLKGKERNIRGVIFSHGHLDHIGAAPILLPKLGNPPVIGRDLTLAMIKERLEDYEKGSAKKLKTINIRNIKERIKLGVFQIGFFQIEHSIMDAVGIILFTPRGTVIHPGDWTMEKDQRGRPFLDYTHLNKLPRPKILMLESLGAIDVRTSATSEEMKKNIAGLISGAPGRVIIGTFSSQIERISWIIDTAEKLGKKIALDGYSMKMNVEIAKKLGYIKYRKDAVIKIDQTDDYPDNKIVILCTGAQGEGNAVLSRIIEGDHRNIKLKKSDTVILSSSIIPGNERTIQRLKDNLYRQCDNVIHGSVMDIHVSGHGNKQDIIHMLKSVRPDYFIPVYANHYMLKEAEKLARNIGFDPRRIFVPDNGQVIEFDRRGGQLTTKKVPASYVFVDGLGITDSNNVVLRDRQMMAQDGMIVIIATIDSRTGQLIHNPDLISRGFVYLKENKKLIEMTRQKVKKILKDTDLRTAPEDQYLKDSIRNEIGKFLYQKTEKRPMILPVIIEV
ncbi:MAG: ribonuclease J [Patescibacteria group bacterium]